MEGERERRGRRNREGGGRETVKVREREKEGGERENVCERERAVYTTADTVTPLPPSHNFQVYSQLLPLEVSFGGLSHHGNHSGYKPRGHSPHKLKPYSVSIVAKESPFHTGCPSLCCSYSPLGADWTCGWA